jgi:5'-deoxynucleotidase YfbR-like HD superfamily hydrolase
MSDLIERLSERAVSYRMGGPSSEHTALILEEAAARIKELEAQLAEANTRIDKLVQAGNEIAAAVRETMGDELDARAARIAEIEADRDQDH